jgi:carbamoyltransferase
LGNRSILANPRQRRTRTYINSKIKDREDFRPFAPAVLLERQTDIFEEPYESPHMLYTIDIRQDRQEVISACLHADSTARIQSVSAETNPLFYSLLEKFYLKTGIPALLNTSLNMKGEPIVNTPEDAIMLFMNKPLDALFIGNYWLERNAAVDMP